MQKCWFALEQTHYVPPTTKSMYRGKPTGPLSLGHIVPSLKKLDQVINAGEMEPIPWGMEIIGPNRMVNFKWSEERRQDLVCAHQHSPDTVPKTRKGRRSEDTGTELTEYMYHTGT